MKSERKQNKMGTSLIATKLGNNRYEPTTDDQEHRNGLFLPQQGNIGDRVMSSSSEREREGERESESGSK